MTGFLFANNAGTTLGSPINNSTTTITLSTGTGSLFPSPQGEEKFVLSLTDAATKTNREICYCTSRTGDVCTVLRGQEGTSAQSWLAGDIAANLLTAGTAQSLQNTMGNIINAANYGIIGDGSNFDTKMQSLIDTLSALYTTSSGISNMGFIINLGSGLFRTNGLIRKIGVTIVGQGPYSTTIYFTNNGGTAMKSPAADSQLSAGTIYYINDIGYALVPDPGVSFTTQSVLFNMTGWSRCNFTNIATLFQANVTAWQMKGATLASEGGPSNWYNNFYNVFTEINAPHPGGIGWDLGDTSSSFEQITTWNWFGGRTQTGSAGTGMKWDGATGCHAWGHIFEDGGGISVLFSCGSASGDRSPLNNGLHACYFEGAGTGWHIFANAVGTVLDDVFATGVTNINASDTTVINNHSEFVFPVGNPNGLIFKKLSSAQNPIVLGQNPGLDLKNENGDIVQIINNIAISSATDGFEVFDVTNVASLIKLGTVAAQIYAPQLSLQNQSSDGWFRSIGNPNGNISANPGSYATNPLGGASTSFYVKESGSGNTGWVGK